MAHIGICFYYHMPLGYLDERGLRRGIIAIKPVQYP